MAQKDNNNAEKWTEKEALKAIKKVSDYNIENKGNYHLGLALIENDLYPELWAYFTNTFKDNPLVFKAIKKVESFLEARIINSTMSGEARGQAMAIFYLKNKHNYRDKTETDITSKGESIIQSPEEREKEIADLIKKAKKE